MTKTIMTEKKRKALLPLVYKKIVEKYPEYDIKEFNNKWQKQIANIFDDIIKKYYNERFIGEYDWLVSQGFLQNRSFSIYPASNQYDLENNIFNLDFEHSFYPTLMYGITNKNDADETVVDRIYKAIREIERTHLYGNACQKFCNDLLEVAKPILKLINSTTYCEDILKIWDTMEVRKVLFPDKVYPISTLTTEDMKALKKFFK